MKIRFISILILTLVFSCNRRKQAPKTLKLAFNYLDSNWKNQEKLEFKKLKFKEYPPEYYDYTLENKLENELLNNHPSSKELNFFFDSIGIKRFKDKYLLILNTYHDFLNENDVHFEEEVNTIKNYWKPIEDCTKALKQKAIKTYNSYNVEEKIIILLPVDEHNNAVDFNCPNNSWFFKEQSDLKITARILNKHISLDSSKATFKLKLIAKNKPYTDILFQELFIGDTFTIPLYNSWKILRPKPQNENETYSL